MTRQNNNNFKGNERNNTFTRLDRLNRISSILFIARLIANYRVKNSLDFLLACKQQSLKHIKKGEPMNDSPKQQLKGMKETTLSLR